MTEDVLPTVYPHGAIRHIEELHKLVARALSGERAQIFWADMSGEIRQLEVLRWEYHDDSSMITTLEKNGKRLSLFPYLRSVAGCSGHGGRSFGEFWFTNYWHAYAYSLKVKQHDRSGKASLCG